MYAIVNGQKRRRLRISGLEYLSQSAGVSGPESLEQPVGAAPKLCLLAQAHAALGVTSHIELDIDRPLIYSDPRDDQSLLALRVIDWRNIFLSGQSNNLFRDPRL